MTGSLLISAPVKAKTRGSSLGMGAANVFFNVVFWFRFQINVNIRCPFAAKWKVSCRLLIFGDYRSLKDFYDKLSLRCVGLVNFIHKKSVLHMFSKCFKNFNRNPLIAGKHEKR